MNTHSYVLLPKLSKFFRLDLQGVQARQTRAHKMHSLSVIVIDLEAFANVAIYFPSAFKTGKMSQLTHYHHH
jgi:hypothetical protein